MLDIAALLKTEEGWKFANEKILEDFVWQNLVHLFKLNPLKRQYSVLGELCDILANEPNTNQLVIVELKNNEVGETSTAVTQRYGLKKDTTDIYQSHLCAEFYSRFYNKIFHGVIFSLWLPFPKGKIYHSRKYCQADKTLMKLSIISMKKDWEEVSRVSSIIVQRNPKPQVHSGEAYSIDTYLWLYNQITGKKSNAHSLDALIDLALEEWKENINE